MSSAGDQAELPRPSVFISYASEDRESARALRDVLAAAGLVVWYDENELGGGDAWDQKIRRQIRDCDYFMPVISAATERRKEGYFRREWRLATERTMDMADDVLFLLPVVIDDTSESGARVPDRFLSVQWLKAPQGAPTPALAGLIRRLLAGEHTLKTRPPTVTRAPFVPPATNAAPEPPRLAPTHLPMPPFPAVPEKSGFFHGVKFIAEVFWWVLSAAWMLFNRLPRWGRVTVTIWLVFSLFSIRTSRRGEDSGPSRTNTPAPAAETPAKEARGPDAPKKKRSLEGILREGVTTVDAGELARLRAEIAQVFGENFRDGVATGKALMVVPFAPPNAADPVGKFAYAVFLTLYGRLSLDHRGEVAVTAPVRGEAAQTTLLTRARHFGSTYVIIANPSADDAEPALTVQLFAVADGSVSWSETFPVARSEAIDVAAKIAGQVQHLLPKKELRRGKPDK